MNDNAENDALTPMHLIGGLQHQKHELRQISISDNPAPEFDYYRATIHTIQPSAVIHELQKAFPLASIRQTAGKWGYDRTIQLYVGDKTYCSVRWSSNGQNKGTSVDSPGADSVKVRQALQCFEHKVKRADVRIDYVEDGIFDFLAAYYIRYATENKLKINQQGDWARGKARTLYIGSRKSAAYLRLYEKGHKEGGNPFWVRLEFEFNPQKETGYSCAKLKPAEYLGLVQWVRISLDKIGIHYTNDGTRIGAQRKPESTARSRLAMTSQYARVFQNWMEGYETADEFCADVMRAIYLQEQHKSVVDHEEKQSIYLQLIDLVEGKSGETVRRRETDGRARTVRSAFSDLLPETINATMENS